MELFDLVNGCKTIELAVASVYRFFMGYFPEEQLFWQDLYRDELEHSFWLSDNTKIEALDLLPTRDLLPSMELVENTLAFVNAKINFIKTNPVTLESALRIALKLEETMIETFMNEMAANLFASDYESLNKRIIAAEKIHINKIEDMMISKGFLQLS